MSLTKWCQGLLKLPIYKFNGKEYLSVDDIGELSERELTESKQEMK